MSKLVPKYTTLEAINAALAVGMKALDEVRTLARTPGKDGARGERGPAGRLPLAKAWSDKIHYESDVVTHEGATYQATRDTAKQPPHDDWQILASAGRDGEHGRSPVVRKTWCETEKYSNLDIVARDGALFIACRDDPGICPGDDWQRVASQGKQGKPGEKGPKGDRGESGAQIVGMGFDGYGVFRLVRSDGVVITCDFPEEISKMMVGR